MSDHVSPERERESDAEDVVVVSEPSLRTARKKWERDQMPGIQGVYPGRSGWEAGGDALCVCGERECVCVCERERERQQRCGNNHPAFTEKRRFPVLME